MNSRELKGLKRGFLNLLSVSMMLTGSAVMYDSGLYFASFIGFICSGWVAWRLLNFEGAVKEILADRKICPICMKKCKIYPSAQGLDGSDVCSQCNVKLQDRNEFEKIQEEGGFED